METVINNQGEKVQVSDKDYQHMKEAFAAGVWMVILTTDTAVHTIILSENF